MTRKILLMVRIGDVPPEIEAEWNNWYDTTHIPNRLSKPGFVSARRFVAIEGECKYLTLYDLNSIDALTSDPYLKLRDSEASLPPDSFEAITSKLPNSSRGIYEQIYPDQGEYQIPNTEIILAVGRDAPPNREEEFNAWYNTEHVPALLRAPGFITARRFRVVEAQFSPRAGETSYSPKYVALYDLENEKAIQSEAVLKAGDTPWTSWVHSWYSRRFDILARRIFPK